MVSEMEPGILQVTTYPRVGFRFAQKLGVVYQCPPKRVCRPEDGQLVKGESPRLRPIASFEALLRFPFGDEAVGFGCHFDV